MALIAKLKHVTCNARVVLYNRENSCTTQTDINTEFSNVQDYLLWKRPESDLLTLDSYKFKLVYSPMQSGKTSMLIAKAIEHTQAGKNVVIVVRDFTMDRDQLVSRLNQEISEINKKIIKTEIKQKNTLQIDVLNVCNVRESDLTKRNLNGCIIVMMANNTQFNKINNLYGELLNEETKETVLMIDEVDFNIKTDNAKGLGGKLMNCNWNVVQRVGVTATALGMFVTDISFTNAQLIVLNVPENYKGVDKMTITTVKPNTEHVYTVYDNIATSKHSYIDVSGRAHPYIILNKTAREKCQHNEIMCDMYDRYSQEKINGKKNVKKWIHLTVNGNGAYILTDIPMLIVKGDKLTKKFYKSEATEHGDFDYDCYVIKKPIREVLQIIKKNMETVMTHEEIQNTVINIIGGVCFSRGISVVSSDYKWHLNAEYYLPGNSTDCASILQALRVCGVFNDEIPLQLWTSENVKNHIIGYNSLQNRLINILQCKKTNVSDAITSLAVREKELYIKRSVGRGVDGKNVKISFKTDKSTTTTTLNFDEAREFIGNAEKNGWIITRDDEEKIYKIKNAKKIFVK